MYSLTIHFGPNAICWAFLFKEKEKADEVYNIAQTAAKGGGWLEFEDDFGQAVSFGEGHINGVLLEDLDLVEAARIQRSLAEERCKVKLMSAARSDPTISAAIRAQQTGPGVLTPFRQ